MFFLELCYHSGFIFVLPMLLFRALSIRNLEAGDQRDRTFFFTSSLVQKLFTCLLQIHTAWLFLVSCLISAFFSAELQKDSARRVSGTNATSGPVWEVHKQ